MILHKHNSSLSPLPKPNKHGWFESVMDPAPKSWPRVLPHYYCVNLAPDPGEEIVSFSASPNGRVSSKTSFLNERTRVELVGYWAGHFGLVSRQQWRCAASAEADADSTFRVLPAKYFMRSGRVIDEKNDIVITGEWPDVFPFRSLQDLSCFCDFLYIRFRERGGIQEAEIFLDSLSTESNALEQLDAYLRGLTLARDKAAKFLDKSERQQLERAIRTGYQWHHD